MDKAVILLSGGMDSATLLLYMQKRLQVEAVYALTFLYGQKHFKEIEMAKIQASRAGVFEHFVLEIPFFGKVAAQGSALTDESLVIPKLSEIAPEQRMQPPTYVPNRNMTFLSIGAAFAESRGIRDVFYGAQAQDEYGYWDCTPDFLRRVNSVFELNRRTSVKAHAPFVGMAKAEVLKIGLELGVDYEHTWSCYRGEVEPCGECPSCIERAKAFEFVDKNK